MEIKVEVKNCDSCPHSEVSKVYTSDSFDNMRSVYCKLLNKDVHSYLGWYDDSPIPEYCPAKIEKE